MGAWLLTAAPATATVNDAGSKIAFASSRDDPNPSSCFANCNYEIYTMNADGGGVQRLTFEPGLDRDPQWSPDGTKIAWVGRRAGSDEIYVMNADGTGQARLTVNAVTDYGPTWSPDGARIAFSRQDPAAGRTSLWTVNADGSGEALFAAASAGNPHYQDPDWAPDGSKVAFTVNTNFVDDNTSSHVGQIFTVGSNGCCLDDLPVTSRGGVDWSPDSTRMAIRYGDGRYSENVWEIDADGTNLRRITSDFFTHEPKNGASWSPHGVEIAYAAPVPDDFNLPWNSEVIVVDEDGTDRTNVTNNAAEDRDPAWQPMLIRTGYVRPKGATPLRVSLVPAYAQCTTPNRTHGAPLAFPSCAPTSANSAYLTVGTPDANGKGANSEGSQTLTVIPGNSANPADEADVRVSLSITDVRKRSDLDDYEGQLRLVNTIRLTDANTVGGYAATMKDYAFNVTVPCTRVPTAQVGGTCSVVTTADTVIPGAVKEGGKTIWALEQVRVYDGGADGIAGNADDSAFPFATQGVFIP